MTYQNHESLAALTDLSAFIEDGKSGEKSLTLFVDGIHCAGCINKIETALSKLPNLESGRVNFSTNQLRLSWHSQDFDSKEAVLVVEGLGFRLAPVAEPSGKAGQNPETRKLFIAMAVAGFGAANIMLLSVALWAGYFSGMGEATRALFHWISALIALPVIAFSGMPFFKSAFAVVVKGRVNMDVPISLAVILAGGLSLYQTWIGGQYAYYDAGAMLLFFLLIGRYLDALTRSRALSVAGQLIALQSFQATVVGEGGRLDAVSTKNIKPGMTVLVRPGEKIPVDGVLIKGASDLDTGLITGEGLPRAVKKGEKVFAGTINLTGPIYLKVEAAGANTLLSEITGMMERASTFKNRYTRWADKAGQIYAPLVHTLGLLTFLGWWLLGGEPWAMALTIAISVLIITCPCALGIAVPAVQVVAIGKLLKDGIVVKSGEALEKLSTLKTAVFDKTGTLTTGELTLTNIAEIDKKTLDFASAMAANSRHPLARALRDAHPGAKPHPKVKEIPGFGLEATINGKRARLGRADWCGAPAHASHGGPELWFVLGKNKPAGFRFQDTLKGDAGAVIAALKQKGFKVVLLSGDVEGSVKAVAETLGIDVWFSGQTPDQKIAVLKGIKAEDGGLLMVGDGLNDAPALALADVSLSPTSAVDISQNAADIVFQGDKLAPLLDVLRMAAKTRTLVFQNFGLAVAYNLVAIPIAVAGLATPLLAAIAMSSSSLVVILNALRARRP